MEEEELLAPAHVGFEGVIIFCSNSKQKWTFPKTKISQVLAQFMLQSNKEFSSCMNLNF